MIPGMEVTARVNGRVAIVEREECGVRINVHNPDDNAILVQGIQLDIDEAYFHCPRSMQFADLWNEETIKLNKARSIKSLKDE